MSTLQELMEYAKKQREERETLLRSNQEARTNTIINMYASGESVIKIAKEVGLTRQRVYQILKSLGRN